MGTAQQRPLSPEEELCVEIGRQGVGEGFPSAPCCCVTLRQCPGLSEHQGLNATCVKHFQVLSCGILLIPGTHTPLAAPIAWLKHR